MLSIIDDVREQSSASIVEQPVMFTTEDDSSFDFERWEVHRSSSRYGRLLLGTLAGSTSRRVIPTIALLVLFTFGVEFYNTMATMGDPMEGFLPEVQIPIGPFELTAPVLGLLLVFRTDTAYDRFNLGSDVAWEITAAMRSVTRRLVVWTRVEGASEEERAAALELVSACMLLHGWIMGSYLRGPQWGDDPTDRSTQTRQVELVRLALGVGADETDEAAMQLDRLTTSQLTPYVALTAIALGVSTRLPTLSDQERVAVDDELAVVTSSLAKCEKCAAPHSKTGGGCHGRVVPLLSRVVESRMSRLLRTPIPLGYTRYAVRFLWIWLTLLPFALVRVFSEFSIGTWWEDKPQPVLALAMLFISFTFLSIEDIAVQIEEPFAILPLELHQRWLLRDIDQMRSIVRWSDARGKS
jgi:putative membrane protein